MAHEVQFYSKDMQEAISLFIELLETKLFVNVTVKQLMEGRVTNLLIFFLIFIILLGIFRLY